MTENSILDRLRERQAYEKAHYPPADPLWKEAADRIATLEAEVVRLQLRSGKPWPIMVDGPHEIGDHRRWLARQLLDSKLTEHEAYGIVAYSPAITDRRAALGAGEGS